MPQLFRLFLPLQGLPWSSWILLYIRSNDRGMCSFSTGWTSCKQYLEWICITVLRLLAAFLSLTYQSPYRNQSLTTASYLSNINFWLRLALWRLVLYLSSQMPASWKYSIKVYIRMCGLYLYRSLMQLCISLCCMRAKQSNISLGVIFNLIFQSHMLIRYLQSSLTLQKSVRIEICIL